MVLANCLVPSIDERVKVEGICCKMYACNDLQLDSTGGGNGLQSLHSTSAEVGLCACSSSQTQKISWELQDAGAVLVLTVSLCWGSVSTRFLVAFLPYAQ